MIAVLCFWVLSLSLGSRSFAVGSSSQVALLEAANLRLRVECDELSWMAALLHRDWWRLVVLCEIAREIVWV